MGRVCPHGAAERSRDFREHVGWWAGGRGTELALAKVQVPTTNLGEPVESYVSPTRRVLTLQALEGQDPGAQWEGT